MKGDTFIQSLEELIQEKYDLYIDIQKFKRKLRIRENVLKNVNKEINELLHTDEKVEDGCLHSRKPFHDI